MSNLFFIMDQILNSVIVGEPQKDLHVNPTLISQFSSKKVVMSKKSNLAVQSLKNVAIQL